MRPVRLLPRERSGHPRFRRGISILLLSATCVAGPRALPAEEREVEISGREIVAALTRLEEGQKSLEQRMEGRLTGLEQRMEGLEQRMEGRLTGLEQRMLDAQGALEKRMESAHAGLESRIRDLAQLMIWGFGVNFAGIFTLIGFVLWDRRTALAPAVRRIDEVDERERRVESALRDYASRSSDFADSLKKSGLL